MGDRVKFQVVGSDGEFSPVIYGHWSGDTAPKICKAIKDRMIGRLGDVQYTAARLVQELVGDAKGNTGFGIWNADAVLTEDDSDGDAGVILVHVAEGKAMRFECFGGYLSSDGGVPKTTEAA